MTSDREDIAECICQCLSSNCRGVYVKARPKAPSPTPLVPVQPPSLAGDYNREALHDYKVIKFVDFMLYKTKRHGFISWRDLLKDKAQGKRYLACLGCRNLNVDACVSFLSRNLNRIKYILKSHGKKLKILSSGFSVLPVWFFCIQNLRCWLCVILFEFYAASFFCCLSFFKFVWKFFWRLKTPCWNVETKNGKKIFRG